MTAVRPRIARDARAAKGCAGAAALALLGLLALPLTGCGGDDDDGAPPEGTPACGDGELAVRGILDGQEIMLRHRERGHTFVNKLGAENGTLDVTTEQGALSLEFGELVPHGASTSAFGWFQDAGRDLDVGNCDTDGFVSTLRIDDDGDGVTFVLRDLRRAPYCGGAAVTGELAGCFRYQSF